MKKTTLLLLVAMLGLACKQEQKKVATTETATETPKKITAPKVTSEMMESAVIYEANIRQYSKEGTFKAFTKDIPKLKELGVKIIWLMPVFPISEAKRKATGDKFASDFPEAEREKYLGSYYAVADFKKINPEFGTIDDFRALVATAHEQGMYVILDWVPNHTGWDHTWITTHPDFYTKNAKGEITDPLNEDGTPVGWQDVADLNYDNPELRKTMIADMSYWITEEGVDGFRCDVAGSVPTFFWEEAIPQLRAKKDIFMLAEAWEPALLKDGLFDMGYAWDRHHAMNDIAATKNTAADWDAAYSKDTARYEHNDILMNFVTNHDENSWNGTIDERMGPAWETFTAMSYVIPGMPLIYSGQEYGLNHRLKFFEKDEIPHTQGKQWEVLAKLGTLKAQNKALNGGKMSAKYERLKSEDQVLMFAREKEGDKVIYLANLSKVPVTQLVELEGAYTDYMGGDALSKGSVTLELAPWEYKILVKK